MRSVCWWSFQFIASKFRPNIYPIIIILSTFALNQNNHPRFCVISAARQSNYNLITTAIPLSLLHRIQLHNEARNSSSIPSKCDHKVIIMQNYLSKRSEQRISFVQWKVESKKGSGRIQLCPVLVKTKKKEPQFNVRRDNNCPREMFMTTKVWPKWWNNRLFWGLEEDWQTTSQKKEQQQQQQ